MLPVHFLMQFKYLLAQYLRLSSTVKKAVISNAGPDQRRRLIEILGDLVASREYSVRLISLPFVSEL